MGFDQDHNTLSSHQVSQPPIRGWSRPAAQFNIAEPQLVQKCSPQQQASEALNAAREPPIQICVLRSAIEQAERFNVRPYQIKAARNLLEREECREFARKMLRRAIDDYHEDLAWAIEQGERIALSERELEPARQLLRVEVAVREVANCATRHNIWQLRVHIQEAITAGLDDKNLTRAREALRSAEENVVECCSICFSDENNTHQMPCCGREGGSSFICDTCLAVILQNRMNCPFCRAAQPYMRLCVVRQVCMEWGARWGA